MKFKGLRQILTNYPCNDTCVGPDQIRAKISFKFSDFQVELKVTVQGDGYMITVLCLFPAMTA